MSCLLCVRYKVNKARTAVLLTCQAQVRLKSKITNSLYRDTLYMYGCTPIVLYLAVGFRIGGGRGWSSDSIAIGHCETLSMAISTVV